MTTTDIKVKLHDEIEHSDSRLLKMIYALVKEYHESEEEENGVSDKPYVVSEERMQIIMEEREKYLRGEGRTYTWEEAKHIIKSKRRK